MNLKRGINLGGYLSQCDYSKEHLASFIHKEDLDRIAEMGFDHVRVPVDYNILETEDGTPIESGYELLDRVTDWCRENKLNMIWICIKFTAMILTMQVPWKTVCLGALR